MTIWLLTLVLMASVAGVGYRQGGVRAAFSSVGILLGVLLAGPLGKLLKPLLVVLGLKNPTLPWLLGLLIIFLLISISFKVAAFIAHQKVDVHYKYHAGDLRLVLWERLNRRLGLCLGVLNCALDCYPDCNGDLSVQAIGRCSSRHPTRTRRPAGFSIE